MYFSTGVNEVSFTVTIRDEGLFEPTEEFYIDLEIPSSASSCSVFTETTYAIVSIEDDDGEYCLKWCKAEHNKSILIASI